MQDEMFVQMKEEVLDNKNILNGIRIDVARIFQTLLEWEKKDKRHTDRNELRFGRQEITLFGNGNDQPGMKEEIREIKKFIDKTEKYSFRIICLLIAAIITPLGVLFTNFMINNFMK